MNALFSKQKVRIIFGVEIIIFLLLIGFYIKQRERYETTSFALGDFSSDVMQLTEDGWELPSQGWEYGTPLLSGPQSFMKAGTYTLQVVYEAEDFHFLNFSASRGEDAYIKAGRIILSKNSNVITYHFELTEDVNAFSLDFAGGGTTGALKVHDISVTRNNDKLSRILVFYVVLCILADIFIVFYVPIYRKRNVIFSLFGIFALVSVPLFLKGIIMGHDFDYHIMRIESLAYELSAGVFPVRMNSLFYDGNGYPSSVYYNDLLLYFPAILRLCGFTITIAYKTYVLAINAGTIVIAYVCFHNILERKNAALLATFGYMTATYRLYDVYIRTAVGEYSALMFMPLVMLALWNIYVRTDSFSEKNQALILAAGVSGLLGTHVLSTEMMAFAVILIVLACFKKTFTWKVIKTCLYTAGLTILLNLYYLVPFMDYYLNVDAVINHTIENGVPKIQSSGMTLAEMFSFFDNDHLITPGLLLILVLGLALALWVNKLLTKEEKFITIFAIVMMFIASCYFPWNKLAAHTGIGRILSQVQFPNRYLSFAILALALLLGCLIRDMNNGIFWKFKISFSLCYVVIISCGILTSIFFISNCVDHAQDIYYYDKAELIYDAGGEEYTRYGTQTDALNALFLMQGGDALTVISQKSTDIEMQVDANSSDMYVEVPRVNYKGYHVRNDAGEELAITDGENNRIAFTVPAGYKGNIRVTYEQPIYWVVATIISAITAVILLIVIMRAFVLFLRNKYDIFTKTKSVHEEA